MTEQTQFHFALTGIVGDTLWAVNAANGQAVVWDQRLVRFRVPTQQESMGAKAHAHRSIEAHDDKDER